MNRDKRPISITILACVYLAVGVGGLVYHFPELLAGRSDSAAIELTELAAVVSGGFMLRGQNWARWLALVWMSVHVAVSLPPPIMRFTVHCVFLGLIAWVLFRPGATRYFRGA